MIKRIINLIILLLIITSVYFWRDEISLYINQFVKSPDEQTTDIINDKSVDSAKEAVINEVENIVETPGALRVYNKTNYFDFSTRLTKQGIVDITNEERINEGLAPLKVNLKLESSALIKVEDMMDLQYFEHVSPEGVSVSDLGNKVNYDYIIIGENLALGNFTDDRDLVDAWMASPGHRANILNKNYTEIGISIGRGYFNDRKVWFAVQHFGTPKDLCPSIDTNLKSKISTLQKKSTAMQKDLEQALIDIKSGEVIDGKSTNEQISQYNKVVNEYNDLVNLVKKDISLYNTQVNKFNTCIQSKQ